MKTTTMKIPFSHSAVSTPVCGSLARRDGLAAPALPGFSKRFPKRQTGSTLLEVLISVFVLAFGLLGVAGLQIASLRNSQSSLQRAQAVFLTDSILDAMRATIDLHNPEIPAVRAGYIGTYSATPPAAPSGTIVERDIQFWRGNMYTSLGPSAEGKIECTGTVCTITIRWDDSRGGDGKDDPDSMKVVNRSKL
ncbi:MAG: type IV pilus modification protein PilV [Azoarcus sp.]|nr:type IV pilus modification protein PilV [Azoarcus sp.]